MVKKIHPKHRWWFLNLGKLKVESLELFPERFLREGVTLTWRLTPFFGGGMGIRWDGKAIASKFKDLSRLSNYRSFLILLVSI